MDPCCVKDVRELLNIGLNIIEFRTSHHDYFSVQKILVEIGIGHWRAIRSHE